MPAAGADAGSLGAVLAGGAELAGAVLGGAVLGGAVLAGGAELAGALAGALDAAATAELLEELQAVTSKAAQAIPAQPATCRALRPFVLNINSTPQQQTSNSGSMSQVSYMTASVPPWLEGGCGGACDTTRSG